MNTVVTDVLTGRESNCMMPFFWMKDGGHDALRARVREVQESGCNEFCVESRTHEDFCGENWWRDMDALLDEAEKRGMRVWILDDKHFPTGMANGLVKQKYPQRRKWHLREWHVDVYGPMKGATLLLREEPEEDALLGAYAIRRAGADESLKDEWLNLTDNVKNGRLRFDIPEGVWRVFFFYKTRLGTKPGQEYYIHPIDAVSVSTLIEAVYEPHYAHYAKYFGNTLAGFFSDEPQLSNDYVNWRGDKRVLYAYTLGLPGLALPWSDALLSDMQSALGGEALPLLASLWYPMENRRADARYAYMDALTRLWRDSFSRQLGGWCEKHGVMYIGHIVEDMNANGRMGYSAGHFFRALDGQHMAGIDLVLHQIIPGLSGGMHTASCAGGAVDPEFFEYVLAKLASSHAHINPSMRGLAMCEVFGAYGWAEGVPMMKALMDHMLVRGINRFVPHAFSPVFPNPDCPPHFGAMGMDPQYSAFGALMRYSNKVAHLLCGARHLADAAIVYHAEAEWCGGSSMLTQKPAKALYDRQIDYDILPLDALASARVRENRLEVNEESYGALIVPGADALPAALLCALDGVSDAGCPVWYVDFAPKGARGGRVVPLSALAGEAMAFAAVRIMPESPRVRVYRASREGLNIYMIANESAVDAYAGEISLPEAKDGLMLDIARGRKFRAPIESGRAKFSLAPLESTILLFGEDLPNAPDAEAPSARMAISPVWEISLANAGEADAYRPLCETDALFDIAEDESRARFAGWMRYRARFTVQNAESVRELRLGEVGVTARAALNGVDLGERFCAPFAFDVAGNVRNGENELEITVANTLAGRVRDNHSTYLQIPRSGLLGPVELLCV